jgi:hypothetical protein
MKVAIIGGGVAGSSAAIYLAKEGVNVTLFEKNEFLVEGPPMCHLHAGGNLYREIDIKQCIQLLKESIEFARFYPHAVDKRPTIIATPKYDPIDPEFQIKRLKILQNEYEKLVRKDLKNKILGEPEDYFRIYELKDLERIKIGEIKEDLEKWLIPFIEYVDLKIIKMPVLLVQEYGLNVFRVSASANLLLNRIKNATLHLKTEVLEIKKENKFMITYKKNGKIKKEKFDYVINSAGFLSGEIDNNLGYKRERFVEFKAAYVTKWDKVNKNWPEIIFHGIRGTDKGMGQFTPYPGGFIQIHGMTKNITLFENGLVKTTTTSQPKLPKMFKVILEKGWNNELVKKRTINAIKHIKQFMPEFNTNKYYKPLYGAQQIPGDDATLRAAEVSFEESYARCEIVKASSVFAMSREILKKLGYKDKNTSLPKLKKEEVDIKSKEIAKKRGYPEMMGEVNNPLILD